MTERERIQQQKKNILSIARQHGISRLRMFGSVVRGEETPASDIDFLVDLEFGASLRDGLPCPGGTADNSPVIYRGA
jgi:predicted nucleotidyltransferase